jgi:hypothetical protein
VGLVDGDPFGDEALQFTKDKCLQREVEIHVESMDKAGNFIGWLWIDGHNLSVALVEAGLATVHFSAERSEHYKALKAAEDHAKAARLRVSNQMLLFIVMLLMLIKRKHLFLLVLLNSVCVKRSLFVTGLFITCLGGCLFRYFAQNAADGRAPVNHQHQGLCHHCSGW